ncbi:MAG: SIMPL domain-containing protein [Thermaurantiacus sp.]
MNTRTWVGLAALAAAVALPFATTKAATLTVVANAEVAATPDIAEVGAGVMTTAATAEAALSENAQRMDRVVRSLRAQGIADRDIQTTGLSVQPQFRYEQNREPILVGFRASNQVRVILRDPRRAGRVVDALVKEGANQIDGPSFRVENPEPLLDRARQEAVRKARARAELYASAAGMRVAKITSISEQQAMRPPPMPVGRALAAEAMADSPVMPGELQLSVTVTMGFELQ